MAGGYAADGPYALTTAVWLPELLIAPVCSYLCMEELAMSKKNTAPSKGGNPKEQPVNRPDRKEARLEPDDHEHPTRDTREAPVPNPNGEPVV